MRRVAALPSPHHRLALALSLPALAVACAEPTCPPVPVRLPTVASTLDWGQAMPAADAEIDGRPTRLLLDTGFPRTALGLGAPDGGYTGSDTLNLGGAIAGPMSLDYSLAIETDYGGVVGNDVLHQLPFVLDARARTTRLAERFDPPQGAPLELLVNGTCKGRNVSRGPDGPHAWIVEATLEGVSRRFLLDTGAEATFVRADVFESLGPRPTLDGIAVASGFAGHFTAQATRARTLSVGDATSTNSLLLTSLPEPTPGSEGPIDVELDWIEISAKRACTTLSCVGRIDGFLGWTFLREFQVSLLGRSESGARTLQLSRFDTQDHWLRDFVGIGVLIQPDASGAKVAGFLSVSPARDAGMLAGDVITAVDGQPVTGASLPPAAPGTPWTLDVLRGGSPVQLSVTVQELLPDPP
jgi:hypothetical protein